MDDVVIIGGGFIGVATAYFLSKEGRKVRVIERDPTYKKASFPLSLGGFRRQFFQLFLDLSKSTKWQRTLLYIKLSIPEQRSNQVD